MNNNNAPEINEAKLLAKKARRELEQFSETSVVCPKCHEHPVEYIDGNRYTLRCKCGYIGIGEIYF